MHIYAQDRYTNSIMWMTSYVPYHVQVGFSHSNILRTVIQHACLRFPSLHQYGMVSSPSLRMKSSQTNNVFPKHQDLRKVFVIFGGDTSERQVSLMSGTNVWLNLQAFNDVSIQLRDISVVLWDFGTITIFYFWILILFVQQLTLEITWCNICLSWLYSFALNYSWFDS